MVHDATFWISLTLAALSYYGFMLFGWWALKTKKTTAPFVYMAVILLGIGVRTTGDLIRLYYLHFDREESLLISDAFWWDARLIPCLIGVLLIVIHMSYRAFWKRHHMDD